jgi:hypothetical protein
MKKNRDKAIAKATSKLIILDIFAPSTLRAYFGSSQDKKDYKKYLKRRDSLEKRILILMQNK